MGKYDGIRTYPFKIPMATMFPTSKTTVKTKRILTRLIPIQTVKVIFAMTYRGLPSSTSTANQVTTLGMGKPTCLRPWKAVQYLWIDAQRQDQTMRESGPLIFTLSSNP